MVEDSEYFESYFSEESESENVTTTEINLNKRRYEDIPESGGFKKHKHKNHLYKPPTVEELNNLKETENLYNNNLFRLQIEELLSEVKIKNKRRKSLKNWVQSFESFTKTLPEYEIQLSDIKKIDQTDTKLKKFINKLAEYEIPFKTDQDMLLKLVKPLSCNKFGLYENNLLIGPQVVLNLNLIIPKSCFHTKDFLNNRYIVKRYYYLLFILEHLKKLKSVKSIYIHFHENNFLIPILKVELSVCSKTSVLIYAAPEEGTFKLNRVLPVANNVKANVFDSDLSTDVLRNTPTILYNSTLGHDFTLATNSSFIKKTLQDLKNVQAGVKLLCIWLKQRELNIGVGSFNENILVYFIVYLFHKKKINKFMSSYQVMRNFWNFLDTSDLKNEPIGIADTPTEIRDYFKSHFDITLFDQTGHYNVTAFLSQDIYKKVQSESKLALKLLDSGRSTAFHQLFLIQLPFHLQYDVIIDLSKSLPLNFAYYPEYDKLKCIGYEYLLGRNYVTEILQKALTTRTLHFVSRIETENASLKRYLIGINLRPEEAFGFLDKGPRLNDFEAARQFRNFWGHFASDRRFKDGSAHVAVYFKTNTVKARRGIIKQILKYFLDKKLNLIYNIYYDELEEILLNKKVVPSYPSGTNEETTLKIIHSSEELNKKLKSLQVSLKITGIHGITDIYAYCEGFFPIPTNFKVGHCVTMLQENNIIFDVNKSINIIPPYVQPIKNVLQLEHSSKWPNDLEALRHIKTAFYIEISKMLETEHKIISYVTPKYIEILFEGLIFRYYLYIPKEIGLLKKVIDENGMECYRESQESNTMDISFNIMPKVIGALKGIQSLYPSFGPGTAIIKRWLRSQLIDDYYFPDVVVSLLNASLYLDDGLMQIHTPHMSFLRFLKFISDFDWEMQTVLVNFNDDITTSEISDLESKIQQNRATYSNLYIIMPYDQGLSVFTKLAPVKEILHRIKVLAKESLNFISSNIQNKNTLAIRELFTPNFEGYNVLIHLAPFLNSRRHENLIFSSVEHRIIVEKYAESDENKIPISDFSPVDKYLEILRTNYGKYAMFFHDSYGGNIIGVLWNPKVFEQVDFKVSRANAMTILDNKLSFNVDAVIEDFYILGKDLVTMIEKK